jgi:hypothetical protein
LGIASAVRIAPAAFLAGALRYKSGGLWEGASQAEIPGVWDAVRRLDRSLNSPTPPLKAWLADARIHLHPGTDAEWSTQKYWVDLLEGKALGAIRSRAPPREQARLQSLCQRHSSSWLAVNPSPALGLVLPGAQFQLLLRWRLGLDLHNTMGTVCARCGEAQDRKGDHGVTCRRAENWSRHNSVADQLARICEKVGYSVRREVPLVGQARPDDVLLSLPGGGRPMALDVTIVHGCGLGRAISAGADLAAVKAAEDSKIAKSRLPCAARGIEFQPVAFTCLGVVGPSTEPFLRHLASLVAEKTSWRERGGKARAKALMWQRLMFCLMRSVGRQLVAAAAGAAVDTTCLRRDGIVLPAPIALV